MRTLRRNSQKLYYSLLSGERPVYERDENGNVQYIDVDGRQIAIETGETDLSYSAPLEFMGNLSMSSGESKELEYGLNLSDYNAVLITSTNLPIDETSLIWANTKPTINPDGTADKNTADYHVVKCSLSINGAKYLLKRLVR
jgi:hypothetical protein